MLAEIQVFLCTNCTHHIYCIHYILVLLITYHILSARQPTMCIASVFEEFAFQSILAWHLFSVGRSVGMRLENKKALYRCIFKGSLTEK